MVRLGLYSLEYWRLDECTQSFFSVWGIKMKGISLEPVRQLFHTGGSMYIKRDAKGGA